MSVTTSGLQSKSSRRAVRHFVELVSSMRFAIALLVILAIASIIGTVLTQEDPYPNYVNQFGPFWADIFRGAEPVQRVQRVVVHADPDLPGDLGVAVRDPQRPEDDRRHEELEGSACAKAACARSTTRANSTCRRAARDTAATLQRLSGEARLQVRHARNRHGATLIAAKRGALTKLGYISAHLAIVIICLGGLLDSNLPIKLQMWLFNKTPISTNAVINDIPPEHRLSSSNPTFRGYAWVPEGQHVGTAILNQQDGSLIQDLPFSIQLEQVHRRLLLDRHAEAVRERHRRDRPRDRQAHSGARRSEQAVHLRRHFDLSVELPGRRLEARHDRLADDRRQRENDAVRRHDRRHGADRSAHHRRERRHGRIHRFPRDQRRKRHERQRRRSMHAASASRIRCKQAFDERLGSGAKTSKPSDLRNVGPSVQYKVRGTDGQAREYNNYMLPVDVAGQPMFLAGMRVSPNDPFRYLRIPADEQSSVKQWMNLRAALADARDACRSGAPVRAAFGAAGERRVAEAPGRKRRARAEPVRRRRRSRRGAAEWPGQLAASRRSPVSSTVPCRRASRKRRRACCCACWKARPGTCGKFPASSNGQPEAKVDEKNSRIRPIVDQCTFGQLSVRIAGLFATRFVQAGAGVGVPADARTGQKSGVSWQPPARTRHLLDVLRT